MHTVILIPTWNNSELLAKCLTALNRLDPQPDKYVFLENNSTDNTLEVIQSFNRPKELIRLWFRDDARYVLDSPYALIAIVRQYLLKRARQLNPDFAIFIDDDIVVGSKDLIPKLTRWKQYGYDIAGGPYYRRYPEGVFLASMWKHPKGGYTYRNQCISFVDFPEVTSAGCMCLSRDIIQDKRVNFYPLCEEGHAEDYGYCYQARKLGYKIILDCTLRIGHHFKLFPYRPWTVMPNGQGIKFSYGVSKRDIEEIERQCALLKRMEQLLGGE